MFVNLFFCVDPWEQPTPRWKADTLGGVPFDERNEGIVRFTVGLSHVDEPTGMADHQVAQSHASRVQ